jgi:hypothetical protein
VEEMMKWKKFSRGGEKLDDGIKFLLCKAITG